jgi:uncharacterized protein YecE (DUF72 family)
MIRVGIGGWTFSPWRDNFYPRGLPQKDELAFASRAVSTIEINGTFYRTQSPDSFRRWAQETPDDFVFSVKAHRLTTHRKVLAEGGDSIAHFIESGPLELGAKLGPILWQLAPTKRFDAEDLDRFCALLPKSVGGRRLRHVLEVRHESFQDPEFVALLRRHHVAVCIADSEKFPLIADPTADFIYARLLNARASVETGYSRRELSTWLDRLRSWEDGGQPKDMPAVSSVKPDAHKHRDCFVYMINGAKERAPAAARTLLHMLGWTPPEALEPAAKSSRTPAKRKAAKT